MSDTPSPLADDLLTGAAAIAEYLGPAWSERKVYHAAARKYLPIGHCGQILIARKSELNRKLSAEDDTPDRQSET